MARDYDSVDLLWTSRGDYHLLNGDLMDTERDPLRSLVQEVKTRASGDQGAWIPWPDLGASVSDLVGQPNNKQTAESIKTRILSSLTRNGFMNSKDIDIKYIPVSEDSILFRLKLTVAPTVANGNSEYLTIHGLYRYEEDQVSFLM